MIFWVLLTISANGYCYIKLKCIIFIFISGNCLPPLARATLTPPPSSSELEPLLSVSPVPELVSDPFSALWSLVMPGRYLFKKLPKKIRTKIIICMVKLELFLGAGGMMQMCRRIFSDVFSLCIVKLEIKLIQRNLKLFKCFHKSVWRDILKSSFIYVKDTRMFFIMFLLSSSNLIYLFLLRNPSLKQQLFSYAILGFALSEAMGLFCLMMAFLLLFAF